MSQVNERQRAVVDACGVLGLHARPCTEPWPNSVVVAVPCTSAPARVLAEQGFAVAAAGRRQCIVSVME